LACNYQFPFGPSCINFESIIFQTYHTKIVGICVIFRYIFDNVQENLILKFKRSDSINSSLIACEVPIGMSHVQGIFAPDPLVSIFDCSLYIYSGDIDRISNKLNLWEDRFIS
jgi:hypothetical protein